MAKYVFPVPAGPIPKTISLFLMASMYRLWKSYACLSQNHIGFIYARHGAKVSQGEGKKRWVQVEVKRGEEKVAEGEFLCVVPERHVLS